MIPNGGQVGAAELERVTLVLRAYLRTDISLSELQAALRNYVTLDFRSKRATREVSFSGLDGLGITIPVGAEDIVNALRKYQSGQMQRLDLSDWASAIQMLPIYRPEGDTEDERWAAGEGPVWDIVGRLATPQIFAPLSETVVLDYIQQLEEIG